MTTLISKEKNIYMCFNTRCEALNFAYYNLTKNMSEDIVKKRDDMYSRVKFSGDRRFVAVCVYEHKTKL